MLKSEQLICRITTPYIKPGFIDPSDALLLDLSGDLINIYRNAFDSSMSRLQLEELSAPLIRRSGMVKIAAGLNKLLLDRCEFAAAEEMDYTALRQKCFLRSAQLLKSGDFSAGDLRECSPCPDIYGDLPNFEKLTVFKEITPAALLNRYNLAQAQGLLFYAGELTLKIRKCDHSDLRKLLKAIKFFRLLAHFSTPQKNMMLIKISGPYSLFGPTAKYALQLANLLPAVVNLPEWELTAAIKFKNRDLTLKLSPKNKLISHYSNLAAYIPEKIRLFHHAFAEKESPWQIIGETPFIDGGNQKIVFPDLSFRHKESGKVFHVELFHRWHAGQLEERISMLKNQPHLPLLLGIDRSLVRDSEAFDALFADAPQVKEKCWLFRDFPGVSTTLNLLNKAQKR